MKIKLNRSIVSVCASLVLAVTPIASQAIPVTYDIGAGSAPGFSASWLHAGTTQMGSSGFYANGQKAGISGVLTIDMMTGAASGTMFGIGDFGQGNDSWAIDIISGSKGTQTFLGGETDLISLNYTLSSFGGHFSTGTFYFADRDFNGGTPTDGPNYVGASELYLWGNNWMNENGAADRATHISDGNIALGMDLYGKARTVPEPGVMALLSVGLLGLVLTRRKRSV